MNSSPYHSDSIKEYSAFIFEAKFSDTLWTDNFVPIPPPQFKIQNLANIKYSDNYRTSLYCFT